MSDTYYSKIHLFFLLFQQLAVLVSPSLDCTFNSINLLSCSWNAIHESISTPCHVNAFVKKSESIKGSCSLPLGVNPRKCEIVLINHKYKGEKNVLTVKHSLNLTVSCYNQEKGNITVDSNMQLPFYNLRLNAPVMLNIRLTTDRQWNLSWSCDYHYYLNKNIEYEVIYKPCNDPWMHGKRIRERQGEMFVPLRALLPNTLYEAKVRVNQTRYLNGKWSEWSQSIKWKTLPTEPALSDSHFIIQVVAPCVAVPIFIILVTRIIFSLDRVKRIFWIKVPDPSQFFDPLMSTHKGNFQKWLSSPFPFSSFSLDTTPQDISPVDINSKMEESTKKSLPNTFHEPNTDNSGHSFSSFSNQGYFFFQFPTTTEDESSSHVYFTYNLEQTEIIQVAPSPSPTAGEDCPLFPADYVSHPQSVYLGFNNSSFVDSPPGFLQTQPPKQEERKKEEGHSGELLEAPPHPPVETLFEKEETEFGGDMKESSSGETTPHEKLQHSSLASQEGDITAEYLSLNEMDQRWV